MTNNVVYFNESEVLDTSKKFNEQIPTFEKVRSEFKDLSVGEILTREQLIQAVNDPDGFLLQTLTAKVAADNFAVGGFKLSPSKLVEMLDTREKSEFIKAAQSAQRFISLFEKVGTITSKNKIEQDKRLVEELVKSYTILAVTDRQKVVLSAMRQIAEIANELEKIAAVGKNSMPSHSIGRFILPNGSEGYTVNHHEFINIGGR
jgi:hypothetical protein